MTIPSTDQAEPEIDDDAAREDEETSSGPISYAISSYGADYPVESLVRRVRQGDIFIPAFQRQYVWKLPQASRFVESLLLGLPVPGIFLSKEEETNKLLVIDGQQRLETLRRFYDGEFGDSEFPLRGVQKPFEGKGYADLEEEDRRKLDDSIIHLTVVKQDSPEEDKSSIYHIFERLNTGGTALTPQQIRNALFHGKPLTALLERINLIPEWRTIMGKVSPSAKDTELILRFLALFDDSANYAPPMKGFLNAFMQRHASASTKDLSEYQRVFALTADVASRCLGSKPFRPSGPFNAAVFDAVMVGLAKRLMTSEGPLGCKEVERAYLELLANYHFQTAYRAGTASADNVRVRLRLATEAFASA